MWPKSPEYALTRGHSDVPPAGSTALQTGRAGDMALDFPARGQQPISRPQGRRGDDRRVPRRAHHSKMAVMKEQDKGNDQHTVGGDATSSVRQSAGGAMTVAGLAPEAGSAASTARDAEDEEDVVCS